MDWRGIGNLIYYSCQAVGTAALDLFWCLLRVAAEVLVITPHFVKYSGDENIEGKRLLGRTGAELPFPEM